jgi:hypothetical protein
LFPAPGRSDIGDRVIAPLQSIAQDAGDHRQRNQQHKDESADPEQLDNRAVAPAK